VDGCCDVKVREWRSSSSRRLHPQQQQLQATCVLGGDLGIFCSCALSSSNNWVLLLLLLLLLTLQPVQVGHIAHLGGALAGVLLVWLLSKLPDPDAKSS
jgi:membrane associated rhomboid family serine protease